MQRLRVRHWRTPPVWFVVACFILSTNGCAASRPASVAEIVASPTSILSPTLVPLTPTATFKAVSPTSQVPTTTPSPTRSPTPTYVPIVPTATLAPLSIETRRAVFQETWELVRDRYIYTDFRGLDWQAIHDEFMPQVEAAETPAAFYERMHELIERLGDDHSRFESPQEVMEDDAMFHGTLKYAGIGALIRTIPEGGLVMQLAEGGPAEQAGLQPRDIVVAIGSRPFTDTQRFGLGGPISAVRGPPGTTLHITVRSFDGTQREIALVRQVIDSQAFAQVQAQRLPGTDIGLLWIDTFFAEDIDQQVRTALEKLTQDGPLKGLIIDVRTNGGGRVDLMAHTVGLFADGGSIGSIAGRSKKTDLAIPSGDALPQLDGVPLVVLTSKDTVSAAEMFAAGMRSGAKARLVGTTTAGNTENLHSHSLQDGSQLWLAELMYLQPDGTPNEGYGVHPDRTVIAEWWRYAPVDDPQIQAALELLNGR